MPVGIPVHGVEQKLLDIRDETGVREIRAISLTRLKIKLVHQVGSLGR